MKNSVVSDGWDEIHEDDVRKENKKKNEAEGWDDLDDVSRAKPSSSPPPLAGDFVGKPLFVQLVEIRNLYKADLTSESDAKVFMSLVSVQGELPRTAGRQMFPVIDDDANPMWNLTKWLGHVPNSGAILKIEVFDEDGVVDDLIANAYLPCEQLKPVMHLKLPYVKDTSHIQMLTIRCRNTPPAPRKKVIVIRHGESLWNEAQQKKSFMTMASRVDHPLTPKGSAQALSLAQRIAAATETRSKKALGEPEEDAGSGEKSSPAAPSPAATFPEAADVEAAESDFLRCRLVLVSPLCRALQTALLCLSTQGDEKQRWELKRNAREKRNFGGRDSSGTGYGANYAPFIEKELQELSERYLSELPIEGFNPAPFFPKMVDLGKRLRAIDMAETNTKWWVDSKESGEEASNRISDLFFDQIMWYDDDVIICVGHSHFFRDLMKLYFSSRLRQKIKEKGQRCGFTEEQWSGGVWKLDNCAVACLTFDFSPIIAAWMEGLFPGAEDMKCIEDALLLFGSKLVP